MRAGRPATVTRRPPESAWATVRTRSPPTATPVATSGPGPAGDSRGAAAGGRGGEGEDGVAPARDAGRPLGARAVAGDQHAEPPRRALGVAGPRAARGSQPRARDDGEPGPPHRGGPVV